MENDLKKARKWEYGEKKFLKFSWSEYGEVKFGKGEKQRTGIFYHKFGNGKRDGEHFLNMEKKRKRFYKNKEQGEVKNMVKKEEKWKYGTDMVKK